jgi:hypothetical protein
VIVAYAGCGRDCWKSINSLAEWSQQSVEVTRDRELEPRAASTEAKKRRRLLL